MIDGIGQLAQFIQQRADGVAQGSKVRGDSKSAAGSKTEPAAFTGLIDRVAAMDANDPDRERKAFRYFLETALLTELGSNLINDPKFHQLVDIVQQKMTAQEGLTSAIRQATQTLLDLADKRGT